MKSKKPFLKTAAGRICCVVLGLAILAGGYFGITALLDPYDCRILEGVTVGGMDVGGMTRGEAISAVSAATGDTYTRKTMTVKVSLCKGVFNRNNDISKHFSTGFRVGIIITVYTKRKRKNIR